MALEIRNEFQDDDTLVFRVMQNLFEPLANTNFKEHFRRSWNDQDDWEQINDAQKTVLRFYSFDRRIKVAKLHSAGILNNQLHHLLHADALTGICHPFT